MGGMTVTAEGGSDGFAATGLMAAGLSIKNFSMPALRGKNLGLYRLNSV